MQVVVEKNQRLLTLYDAGTIRHQCKMALGLDPVGAKRMQGDHKTPEGLYRICLIKEQGKYGKSLGLSYPNGADAKIAFDEGRIDHATYDVIISAQDAGVRPPWGSPLGGEIYLHEGDISTDWTAGCIALLPEDMSVIFSYRDRIDSVLIRP